MDRKLVKVSKFLSLVLRHQPERIGVSLDEAGWARVSELIKCARRAGMSLSEAVIAEVVQRNDKWRFTLSEDGLRIRANQGPSLSVDLGLEPIEPPDVLPRYRYRLPETDSRAWAQTRPATARSSLP